MTWPDVVRLEQRRRVWIVGLFAAAVASFMGLGLVLGGFLAAFFGTAILLIGAELSRPLGPPALARMVRVVRWIGLLAPPGAILAIALASSVPAALAPAGFNQLTVLEEAFTVGYVVLALTSIACAFLILRDRESARGYRWFRRLGASALVLVVPALLMVPLVRAFDPHGQGPLSWFGLLFFLVAVPGELVLPVLLGWAYWRTWSPEVPRNRPMVAVPPVPMGAPRFEPFSGR